MHVNMKKAMPALALCCCLGVTRGSATAGTIASSIGFETTLRWVDRAGANRDFDTVVGTFNLRYWPWGLGRGQTSTA
jgi:hypothetical protein